MEHRFELYTRDITYDQCIVLYSVVADYMNTHGGHIHEFHMWTPGSNGEGRLAFYVGGLENSGHIGMFNMLTAAVEGYGGRVVFWTVSGSEEVGEASDD